METHVRPMQQGSLFNFESAFMNTFMYFECFPSPYKQLDSSLMFHNRLRVSLLSTPSC